MEFIMEDLEDVYVDETDKVERLFTALFLCLLSLAGMLPLLLGGDPESDATPVVPRVSHTGSGPPVERGLGMMGILALVRRQQLRLPSVAF